MCVRQLSWVKCNAHLYSLSLVCKTNKRLCVCVGVQTHTHTERTQRAEYGDGCCGYYQHH